MNGSRLKLELDGTDYENEGFPDGVISSPLQQNLLEDQIQN